MSRSAPLRIGSKHSGFIVKAAAASVSGHAYWSVSCDACGVPRTERGTLLRNGKARCSCLPSERKAPTHTLAGLAAQIELMADQIITLHQQVSALKQHADAALEPVVTPAPTSATPAKKKHLSFDEAVAEAQQLVDDKVEPERIRQLTRRMSDIIDYTDLDKQPPMRSTMMGFFRILETWPPK